MYPNAFLQTFWRPEIKKQIFVAMSFSNQHLPRFESVIKPAIESIQIDGIPLTAFRVDNSKTGDSILTEIIEGIAHSQLVLADLSTMGVDSETATPYRNGNVMYEVGIALACRQSTDVLLIRDDNDRFLFDVSTIPHVTIDFRDTFTAKERLESELRARLKEQKFYEDARVKLAISQLTSEELRILKSTVNFSLNQVWGLPQSSTIDFIPLLAFPRLLEKGIIKLTGSFSEGHPAYVFTPLGKTIADFAVNHMNKYQGDETSANQS